VGVHSHKLRVVLQCVVLCGCVLQRVAVGVNNHKLRVVLQCVVVRCSMLLWVFISTS